MKRMSTVLVGLVAMIVAGLTAAAMAQQGVAVQPQASVQQVRPPVSRSYRSYSVTPSNELRGSVRYSPRHSREATWRHGDSKAMGNYKSGR